MISRLLRHLENILRWDIKRDKPTSPHVSDNVIFRARGLHTLNLMEWDCCRVFVFPISFGFERYNASFERKSPDEQSQLQSEERKQLEIARLGHAS